MWIVPLCRLEIIYGAIKYNSLFSDAYFHIFLSSHNMLESMNDFFTHLCVSSHENDSILQSFLFKRIMKFNETAHTLTFTANNNDTIILFFNLIYEACFA